MHTAALYTGPCCVCVVCVFSQSHLVSRWERVELLYALSPCASHLGHWGILSDTKTQTFDIEMRSLNTQKCLFKLRVLYHNVAQTPELHRTYFIVLWSRAWIENEAETLLNSLPEGFFFYHTRKYIILCVIFRLPKKNKQASIVRYIYLY